MSTFKQPVPIVDFSRLIKGEADSQAAAIIHKACCDSGFFYLSNFGIDADEIMAVEKAMRWFFALPIELKQGVASSKQDRYSVPYFFNPVYSANYQPLAEILGRKVEPHYSAINWGHFRHERQHGDYGDYGDEIQISDFTLV